MEPNRNLEERLKRARQEAVDATLAADDLQRKADKARREARVKNRHYERLLLEHEGQLKLPLGEGWEPSTES